MSLPDAWRELNANQRDLLLSLALDGPGSGRELFDRVGGVDGHRRAVSTYRGLDALEADGLVTADAVNEREDRWHLTADGSAVVDSFRAAVA